MAANRQQSPVPAAALPWQELDFDAFCQFLRNAVESAQQEHSRAEERRGKSYVPRVREIAWCANDWEITCQVQGSVLTPYRVKLRLILDDASEPLGIESVCSCPYSDNFTTCKHTYAATTRVLAQLRTRGDKLAETIYGRPALKGWKKLLGELDRFVENCKRDDTLSIRGEDAPQHQRTIWRVQIEERPLYRYEQYAPAQRLLVVPVEQKVSKRNGQWTGGRVIDWQRFARESSFWTTETDKRIATLATAHYANRYYGFSYQASRELDPVTLLNELVGHPHVFFAGDIQQPVQVVRGQLGILVCEASKGYSLAPAIDGTVANDEHHLDIFPSVKRLAVRLDMQAFRIVVASATKSSMQLCQRLVDTPVVVPAGGKDELPSRLPSIEAHLPVKLPDSLIGVVAEADRRIVVRLTPQEPRGMLVGLSVRPVDGGSIYEPGTGRSDMTSYANGQWTVVKRDLDEETRLATTLAEELQLNEHTLIRPWRWQIADDDQALDFLAALQDRTDDERVIEWPQDVKWSVTHEVTPSALRVQIEDRQDWFGLKGTIDIEGHSLPLIDVLSALREGKRYIAIGKHQWVRIAKAFRDRLAALDDVVHHGRSGMEIDVTAAPALESLIDDQVTLKACKAWKDSMRRLDNAQDLNPDPPVTLAATLRDYQIEGYRWLRRLAAWGVGGCLADDMGLGKTVQTLAVLIDRADEGPALVIAPTSVGFNWVREAERFAPTLRPLLYRETDRSAVFDSLGKGDVLVISYGLLLRDADKLAEVAWGTLVLDEAQKIKNAQTKTAQEVRKLNAGWRLALTGTPMENHLGELWSMFRAVSPGLFGSWDRFRERFAEPIERRKDPARRHALSRVVRPFILRRLKAEVLDELPERTEIRRAATLSQAEKKRYADTRLAAVAKFAGLTDDVGDGHDRRFEVLAALTKLRQLACHPRLVDDSWQGSSAKLDLFLEIVDELQEANHRVLVFSQFTQHLGLIREALDHRGLKYLYLDGHTPAKEREQLVDAFQHGEGTLFLISLKAGGTGLNLTAADYVIHMDPWWNPAVEDQATDRAHRIGQTRPVTVYRIVAEDTIEEQILALHADKRNLVSGVLDGTDQAAKLSTQDLVALIRGGEKETPTSTPTRSKPPVPTPKAKKLAAAGRTRAPR